MPSTPDQFDLDAWIAGATPRRTHCRVTLRAGLVDQITELDEQISGADEDARTAVAEQRAALVAEFEDSFVSWRFRGLTQGDLDAVDAAMSDPLDATERGTRLIAQQVIEPVGVTYETIRAMSESDVVPVSVFNLITETALAARDETNVSIPFWPNAFRIRETAG